MMTNALLPTHKTGFAGVPLSFRVPDQFVEIDLRETPQQRIDRTFTTFRSFAKLTDGEILNIAVRQEAMIMRLVDGGAVYAGTCLARTEDDVPRLVVAQLVAMVKDMDLDAADPLAAAAGGLKQPGTARDVGFLDLPSGKAMMVAERVDVSMPSTVTGRQVTTSHNVRQLQAVVPFPDKQRAAIFALSSETEAGWLDLVDVFGKLLSTVSFRPPSDTAVLDRLSS